MTADCDVYDGWPISTATRLVNDVKNDPDNHPELADDGKWYGWTCEPNNKWVLNGDGATDGFFYFEGNVVISANPGEGTDAVKMSIVAEGYIEVSGNARSGFTGRGQPESMARGFTETEVTRHESCEAGGR